MGLQDTFGGAITATAGAATATAAAAAAAAAHAIMVLDRRVVLTAAAAAVTSPPWRTFAGPAAAAPPRRVSQLGSASAEYVGARLCAAQGSNPRLADPGVCDLVVCRTGFDSSPGVADQS